MGRIQGKVALVSGGASGMGEGIVRRFVAEGARVVFVDRDQPRGVQLAAETGTAARFVHMDVTDPAAWESAVSGIKNNEGSLDILVNSAGIVKVGSVEECSIEDYRSVQAVNAEAMFLGSKYCISLMRASSKSASIVNVISDSAHRPTSNSIAYAASKGTAMNITRSVALHCAEQRYPIRCNSVLPGVIDTPMFRGMLSMVSNPEEAVAALLARYPMGRKGTVEEVAATVLFLASDEASFITGIGVPIDGGCCLV